MRPTREQVLSIVAYDAERGIFTRLIAARNRPIGSDATVKSNNYRMILIGEKCWHAHRLAWLIVNGEWPKTQIDHINGDPSDNRIANLRLATPAQNAQNKRVCSNSKSGIKGVSFDPKRGKWGAFIQINKRQTIIGRYGSLEDAAEAYRLAAQKHFGEYARTI